LGIEWSIQGQQPQNGAVISNHLSYLDILVFAAVQPFVMVAKSEVRRWPLIGWMTARAGTVFVVRGGSPATYPAVNRAMAEAYRSGLPVLFFPEGTTTDGSEVLPFRRGLFHSVLNEGAALRPAALSYALDEQDCERGATVANDVCWWGDALLAPHLFQFAGMRGAKAKIRFGDAVNERADRFELSAHARDRVTRMVAELGRGASRTMTHAHEAELAEAL
jgi:1-acyl-sn-glycerol-3-phosphate acyltransferase